MTRKNSHVTDLKYNTKRRIEALERSIESISAQWGDVDFFIASELEQILNKLSEIKTDVHGVDAKSH